MPKDKTGFFCAECGYECGKWMGKCPACGAWNTFAEAPQTRVSSAARRVGGGNKAEPITAIAAEGTGRIPTGIGEMDRVLGGGLVPGSCTLIGGDPGVGKSTLLLQACGELAKGHRVLYITGEESLEQVKQRAVRLGISEALLFVLAETDVENMLEAVDNIKPGFIVIDSVQTMSHPRIDSAPGSVSQVREGAAAFTRLAKTSMVSVMLIGHVTKEGALAGPRILEHMVDTVLYFEGERTDAYRIVRTVKNRFGSTQEIGVFEMREAGMQEVPNPSALFLSGRERHLPGCAVICAMEGTRPLLAELQALLSTSAFGMPRRMATGMDYQRVVMLMAVLEKRLGLALHDQDAYVNVVGGLRLQERAADLGVVAALVSSFRSRPVDMDTVLIGEVGLTGEVRAVSHLDKRLQESAKLGFKRAVIPAGNTMALAPPMAVTAVQDVREALEHILA